MKYCVIYGQCIKHKYLMSNVQCSLYDALPDFSRQNFGDADGSSVWAGNHEGHKV